MKVYFTCQEVVVMPRRRRRRRRCRCVRWICRWRDSKGPGEPPGWFCKKCL